MKKETTGIFFDGESAVPKKIELIFDIEKGVFVFETENDKHHFWNFNEVSFQTKSNSMYLEYGNDPIQNIKICDSDFIDRIHDFRITSPEASAHSQPMQRMESDAQRKVMLRDSMRNPVNPENHVNPV